MSNQTNLLDRTIDLLRSRATLFLLTGFALGWLTFMQPQSQEHVFLQVTNHDDIMVESIHLEFGYNHNQSDLLSLQLRPGETRLLLLNHPPGRGFNVEVRYADGQVSSFCANRGVRGSKQTLPLQR